MNPRMAGLLSALGGLLLGGVVAPWVRRQAGSKAGLVAAGAAALQPVVAQTGNTGAVLSETVMQSIVQALSGTAAADPGAGVAPAAGQTAMADPAAAKAGGS